MVDYAIGQTEEFRGAIRAYLRANPQMRESMTAKMSDIMANPLMGSPKTGLLIGMRQIHFPRHFVMTWQLEPVITNPDHLKNLKKLTWARFERHPE